MKRYRVILTPRAAEDIRQAYHWYQEETPVFARQWLAAMRDAILALETLPEAHPLARENVVIGGQVRQLLVGKGRQWRVFFIIDADAVQVLHVRHASRDLWLDI